MPPSVAASGLSHSLSVLVGAQTYLDAAEFRAFVRDAWHVVEPASPFVPGFHIDAIAEHLQAVSRGDIRNLLITVPPRHGKALVLNTPVATPSGWTTMGELRPGDQVFADDGRPCNVVAVSPVWKDRAVYCVRTDDGDEIVADAEHEWVARLDGKRPIFRVHTTERLARKRAKRAMIRRQGPLQMPAANLSIDPYVLGLWLGDGNSAGARITAGDQDRAALREMVHAGGYVTTDQSVRTNFGVLGLQKPLRNLGVLGNKHIPRRYLRASVDQRLALLQGLVDSDGYVAADGQVEVCTISETLAWDIHELVCSLGRKASIILGRATIDGRDCGTKYRVMFYLANAARLSRKAKRCRDVVKTPHRYVSATPAGTADTVCIQVDSPSHMFLVGRSMLPTHNSTLVSVLWPAWSWIRKPWLRWMFASYAASLSIRDSVRCRRLVESPWYQQRWGDVFTLTDDQNQKIRFENDQGGYRLSTSVGGAATGEGGHILVCDDPHAVQEAESEAVRESTLDWWDQVMSTRLNDPATGARVIVQQRVHELDLAGHVLQQGGYTHLNLPAEYEPKTTVQMPSSAPSPIGWSDPRIEPGQLLWPERFDRAALDDLKLRLGSRAASAQLQQEPTPASGDILKREWWRFYARLPEKLDEVWQSWDMAFKDLSDSDYVVGQVWGRRGSYALLLDQVRARMTFVETLDAVRTLTVKHPKATRKLVEEAANGYAVLSMLEGEVGGLVRVKPEGGKVSRATAVSPLIEAGNVLLPGKGLHNGWVDDFIAECSRFPRGAHDDQVDAMTQALAHMTWTSLWNRADRSDGAPVKITGGLQG